MKSTEEGRKEGNVAGGSWHTDRRCFIPLSLFNRLMHSLDPAKGMMGRRQEKGAEREGGVLIRA